MRESTARKFGLEWHKDRSTICGFGENAITQAVGAMQLDLQIDNAQLANVSVLIVPDISSPREFIIGRPWSESPKISYVKNKSQLTFYNVEHFPFEGMDVDGVLNKQPVTEITTAAATVDKRPLTLEDITIGSSVKLKQQVVLLSLLNEYRNAFAVSSQELGCTNLVTIDIVEEKDSRPVVSQPYRTSMQERQQIA